MKSNMDPFGRLRGGPEPLVFESQFSGIRDIAQIVDAQRISLFHVLVVFLCFFVVGADGFDTVAIGFVASSLVTEWGIKKSELGPIMGAALLGLGFGALIAGPIADRVGRKAVLIASVVSFGVFSLMSAYAGSVRELSILRLLTGLGLGAAMPMAVTMVSEFVPSRFRTLAVNTMYCGYSLGLVAGSLLSAWIITVSGWPGIFFVGGVFPLVVSVALIAFMPESIHFLAARGPSGQAKLAKAICRVAPVLAETVRGSNEHSRSGPPARSALRQLASPKYRLATMMLWLTYFMGLLVFYLLMNWLPILLRDAGFSPTQSGLLTALFPIGGILGNLAVGWLTDRMESNFAIALAFGFAAVLLLMVSHSTGSRTTLGALLFSCGVLLTGAVASMSALAAASYPTSSRATGVAWMQGIGRFGGVVGAWAGAWLMGLNWHLGSIFSLLAVPAFLAVLALCIKAKGHSEDVASEASS